MTSYNFCTNCAVLLWKWMEKKVHGSLVNTALHSCAKQCKAWIFKILFCPCTVYSSNMSYVISLQFKTRQMFILIYLSIKPRYSILWILRQIYIDNKLILHTIVLDQLDFLLWNSKLFDADKTNWTGNSSNNLLSYCGSIDVRISDSDK